MRVLTRYLALTRKEFQQLRRNRRLLVMVSVPPTVVLVVFGFALNPEVKNLRTGVVDYSRTPQSRSLLSAITANEAFRVNSLYASEKLAERDLRRLRLDLVLTIPPDFARSLARGRAADVAVWIDAVNANTAAIAQGYLRQILADYNRRMAAQHPGSGAVRVAARPEERPAVESRTVIFYNPGLITPWFFVTGVMSLVLFITGSLLTSALVVREKEMGTIEQLLMSPAQTFEILFAKTTPPLVLLTGELLVSLLVARLVFSLPMRGSLLLLVLSGAVAALAGIGIGILLATVTQTQQQAQLLTFFINPPLVLLSGAFSPIENMPQALQYLSVIDPLTYFMALVRGITLKGAGLDVLWPSLAALAAFAAALYGLSAWRFRRQLG